MSDWAGVTLLASIQIASFTYLASEIRRLDKKLDDVVKLYIDHLEKHHVGE